MAADPINEGQINKDKELNPLDNDDDSVGKTDKAEQDEGQRITGTDDGTPFVGMVFNSYGEAINFYKRYAMRVGFGVTIKKSSFTTYGLCRRLVLACTKEGKGRTNACYQSRPTAKTNCEAKLIAKLWGDGLLHVSEVKLDHNHELNHLAARSLSCYKRLPSGMAKDLAVRSAGREDLPLVDNKYLSPADEGRLKLGEGNDEAIHQFFARMQTRKPNFFYLFDLDMEGHLRNVFWADSRSRMEYQYYDDVVYFDSTYLRDKYKIPLALFVGSNNHGQLVLLGCGLLSDETSEDYLWLFKAWQTCMLEKPPIAMITEQSKAIQDAVAHIFPKSRYRMCLWHITKSIPEKLREYTEWRTIQKAMNKVIFHSLKVDQFEEGWRDLTKTFGLESNEWLNSLYENRHLWAPVFLKDTFWAGLSTSCDVDSLKTFFEGCISPETSLKDFLSSYEMILQSKYEVQAQADFESCNKNWLPVYKYPMEEQLSQLYTLNMFSKFQDELKATDYCQVSVVKVDGSISTFEVKECHYTEGDEGNHDKNYEVRYHANEFEVQCICGHFQFIGILCRHALSVLMMQRIYDIPSKYILNRWRKDFKKLHALDHVSKDVVGKKQMDKYDYLSLRCLQLVEFGVVSEEKYHLALKLIREVERSLLDDDTCQGWQRMITPSESRLNRTNENHTVSHLGVLDGNKAPSSIPAKRRGRPPKKRKESEVDQVHNSSNEVDSARALSDGSQSNLFHALSTPQLGTHDRTHGGVDLMEEVNQNNLSFGSHFGLHGNQQHLDNQLQAGHTLQPISPTKCRKPFKDPMDLSTDTAGRPDNFWPKNWLRNAIEFVKQDFRHFGKTFSFASSSWLL